MAHLTERVSDQRDRDNHIFPTAMLLPSYRTYNRVSPLLHKKISYSKKKYALVVACVTLKDGALTYFYDEEFILKSCNKWGREWPSIISMDSMEVPPNATEAAKIATMFEEKAKSISDKLFEAVDEMADFVDDKMLRDTGAEMTSYLVMTLDKENTFEELYFDDVMCMYRRYQSKAGDDTENEPLSLEDFEKLHEEIALNYYWNEYEGSYGSLQSIGKKGFPACTFATDVLNKYGDAKKSNQATFEHCQNFKQLDISMMSESPPAFPKEVAEAMRTFGASKKRRI